MSETKTDKSAAPIGWPDEGAAIRASTIVRPFAFLLADGSWAAAHAVEGDNPSPWVKPNPGAAALLPDGRIVRLEPRHRRRRAGVGLTWMVRADPLEAVNATCVHAETKRGDDAPLLYGSHRTEVCLACGAFRTHGHNALPSQIGAWASEWKPASEYAAATADEDDDDEQDPLEAVGDVSAPPCAATDEDDEDDDEGQEASGLLVEPAADHVAEIATLTEENTGLRTTAIRLESEIARIADLVDRNVERLTKELDARAAEVATLTAEADDLRTAMAADIKAQEALHRALKRENSTLTRSRDYWKARAQRAEGSKPYPRTGVRFADGKPAKSTIPRAVPTKLLPGERLGPGLKPLGAAKTSRTSGRRRRG
jgi:hypothetical protein